VAQFRGAIRLSLAYCTADSSYLCLHALRCKYQCNCSGYKRSGEYNACDSLIHGRSIIQGELIFDACALAKFAL